MTEQEIDIVVGHLRREAMRASRDAQREPNHPSHIKESREKEFAFKKAAKIIEGQRGAST